MSDDQRFPFRQYRGPVGEEPGKALDSREVYQTLGYRQAQAVGRNGAGGHGPELIKILGDDAERFAPGAEECDRSVGRGERRVQGTGVANQDVGVEEYERWASSRSR